MVAFTAAELFEMATEVVDPAVRSRLVCALDLIDQELAASIDRG